MNELNDSIAAPTNESNTNIGQTVPEQQNQDFLNTASQELSQEKAVESSNGNTDEARYQYWQSQYDKMRVRNDEVEQQIHNLEKYKPLVEYLSSNPDLIDMIQKHKEPKNYRPEQPVRPQNYDPVEAVTNPQSESFRYRQDLDEYRGRLSEFLDKRYQEMEERDRNIAAQREQMAKQQEAQRQVYSYLKTQHSMEEAEIADFVNVMGNEQSLSPENLVRFYKFIKGNNGNEAQQSLRGTQPQMNLPPLGPLGGKGNPTLSEDEMFSRGFMPERKRKF